MKFLQLAVLGLLILSANACKKESAKDLFSDGSTAKSSLSDIELNSTNSAPITQPKKAAEPEEVIDPATAAVLTLAKKEHDFGDVQANTKVDHYFTFVNTGKSPLIIKNAKGSCGCTVPIYPKTPIAPGQKDSIKVQFSAPAINGKTSKTVTLTTNTVNKKELIRISANVVGGKDRNQPAAKPANIQVQQPAQN